VQYIHIRIQRSSKQARPSQAGAPGTTNKPAAFGAKLYEAADANSVPQATPAPETGASRLGVC